ncbi:uncharacterized protein [Eurosta solidaginis]|uniref:uncharacterized protein isoform X1 n=1 Tax=Eurosta solidaginis TaxID=178769 RepID=UPI0035310EE3
MLKHLIANSPLLVLIFLTSSYLVAGQGRKPGSCRTDIQYLQRVDRARFEGIWYMHHGMTLDNPRAFRCRRMNFTYLYISPDETGYRAEAFRIRNRGETPIVSVGSLKFPSNCGAQFRITYWPRANPGTGEIDWNNLRYKVLFSDSELLIIYACQNFESSSEHAENHQLAAKLLVGIFASPIRAHFKKFGGGGFEGGYAGAFATSNVINNSQLAPVQVPVPVPVPVHVTKFLPVPIHIARPLKYGLTVVGLVVLVVQALRRRHLVSVEDLVVSAVKG